MHAVVLEYQPMTWHILVSFEFLGILRANGFFSVFGPHHIETVPLIQSWFAAWTVLYSKFILPFSWLKWMFLDCSSWEFHVSGSLHLGMPDVLNSQKFPPCHHYRLHIFDTTCFLLWVSRMPSVHRLNFEAYYLIFIDVRAQESSLSLLSGSMSLNIVMKFFDHWIFQVWCSFL